MINKTKNKHLLKNREVIEEINRHLWIESEKAGYDIGFETASEQWIEKFSKVWMDYHFPPKASSKGSASAVKRKDVSPKSTLSTLRKMRAKPKRKKLKK